MILIPPERLADELLGALIEDFITREGTDYGQREFDLEAKVAQVRRQITRGQVLITFSEDTETCSLLPKREYEAWQKFSAEEDV